MPPPPLPRPTTNGGTYPIPCLHRGLLLPRDGEGALESDFLDLGGEWDLRSCLALRGLGLGLPGRGNTGEGRLLLELLDLLADRPAAPPSWRQPTQIRVSSDRPSSAGDLDVSRILPLTVK